MQTNSQLALPRHLHLADLDGDGADEFVQVAGNRLLVTRVNPQATGVLHAWFTEPIRQVIVGRFSTTGRIPNSDQLLVVLGDGSLRAYSASDDRQELWWWFTQPSFIADDEHVIVGDIDGDGQDELLLYHLATGRLRCFARRGNAQFVPLTGFTLGDLAHADLTNKLLMLGRFGGADRRVDLVVVDRRAGKLTRYDSTSAGSSGTTFRQVFTTATGLINRTDQVRVANIEGGATDGVIVRNRDVGSYRLLRLEPSGGSVGTATGADIGQLPVMTGDVTIAIARVKEADLRTGTHESARHDVLAFDRSASQYVRTDGRHDPTTNRDTFWWAYTEPTPTRDEGWPTRRANDRWAVILAKLSDTSKHGDIDFYERLFTRPGGGAMVDYFMDISYGAMDISASKVFPTDDTTEWYDCGYTTKSSPRGDVVDPHDHQTKDARPVIFGAAVRASKLDLTAYGHTVVVFNVANTAYGGSSDWVTLDAGGLHTAGIAQEMLHGYGLPHSLDQSGQMYGDPWDIMSGLKTETFTGFNNGHAGPDMNATTKDRQGFIPKDRIRTLRRATRPVTTRVRLAALNRPEARGSLMVRIPATTDDSTSYTIEFRQATFWDRGIPADTVLVHADALNSSLLLNGPNGPNLSVGETFTLNDIKVHVDEIHGSDHAHDVYASTAIVTITH